MAPKACSRCGERGHLFARCPSRRASYADVVVGKTSGRDGGEDGRRASLAGQRVGATHGRVAAPEGTLLAVDGAGGEIDSLAGWAAQQTMQDAGLSFDSAFPAPGPVMPPVLFSDKASGEEEMPCLGPLAKRFLQSDEDSDVTPRKECQTCDESSSTSDEVAIEVNSGEFRDCSTLSGDGCHGRAGGGGQELAIL